MNKTIFATTFLLSIVVLTTAVGVVGVTPTVFAQNSDFIYNPENGSHYLYVASPAISWIQANVAADAFRYNGVNGHLVTITSQSENYFIADLVPENSRVWIGLIDETTEGTYQWVTDEPFDYSNWDVNQPDDYNNEDYVELIESSGKWNDLPNYSNDITGFVVEYPISISNTDPVLNPENGHYYEYIIGHEITWHDAKAAAESRTYNDVSGHLVTITSQSENDFVANLSQDDFRPWIGLTNEGAEGDYRWVTGESFDYANWSPGEPSRYTNENYVEFFASNDKWNDNTNNNHYITGYIIEYSD